MPVFLIKHFIMFISFSHVKFMSMQTKEIFEVQIGVLVLHSYQFSNTYLPQKAAQIYFPGLHLKMNDNVNRTCAKLNRG